jgi:outer membrane protein
MKLQAISLALLSVFTAGAAQAQSAGSIIGRIGVTQIRPQVDSADLSAPSFVHTTINIKAASQLSGGLTYMATDHLAIDLPIGLPFKHDIVGDGAINQVGKIGDVKSLPITVLGQYRFGEPNAQLRPLVGAGLVYGRFYHARATAVLSGLTGGTPSTPTTLSMKNAFGPAIQLGLIANFGSRYSAELSVLKVQLKSTGTLSTGQTIDASLDPVAIHFALGYRY